MAKTAKKGTFTFKELGEIIMRKYPGKFKDLASASVQCAHVAQRLGIEDINGKKKYKQITASDAERVLEDMRNSYDNHPRKQATPIEKAVRDAEKFAEPQAVTSEQVDVQEKAEINVEHINNVVRKHTEAFLKSKALKAERSAAINDAIEQEEKIKLTAVEKKALADEFEEIRKHFYTDARYWLNMAQSPAERIEIWKAIAALYACIPAKPKVDPVSELRNINKQSGDIVGGQP